MFLSLHIIYVGLLFFIRSRIVRFTRILLYWKPEALELDIKKWLSEVYRNFTCYEGNVVMNYDVGEDKLFTTTLGAVCDLLSARDSGSLCIR